MSKTTAFTVRGWRMLSYLFSGLDTFCGVHLVETTSRTGAGWDCAEVVLWRFVSSRSKRPHQQLLVVLRQGVV